MKKDIGFKLPAFTLGSYTLNMVLQTVNCCGANNPVSDWSTPGSIVLGNGAVANKDWRSIGTEATINTEDFGVRRGTSFYGPSIDQDFKPRIVGFTFLEGRLKTYINGELVSTVAVYSNSRTTFEWLNGWINDTLQAKGQIAEVKLYRNAYDAATMKRLHALLDCKWHVYGADEAFADCSTAAGTKPEPGGGGTFGPIYVSNLRAPATPELYRGLGWPALFGGDLYTLPMQLGELEYSEDITRVGTYGFYTVYAKDGDGNPVDDVELAGSYPGINWFSASAAADLFGPTDPPGLPMIAVVNMTVPLDMTLRLVSDPSTTRSVHLNFLGGELKLGTATGEQPKAYHTPADLASPVASWTERTNWDFGYALTDPQLMTRVDGYPFQAVTGVAEVIARRSTIFNDSFGEDVTVRWPMTVVPDASLNPKLPGVKIGSSLSDLQPYSSVTGLVGHAVRNSKNMPDHWYNAFGSPAAFVNMTIARPTTDVVFTSDNLGMPLAIEGRNGRQYVGDAFKSNVVPHIWKPQVASFTSAPASGVNATSAERDAPYLAADPMYDTFSWSRDYASDGSGTTTSGSYTTTVTKGTVNLDLAGAVYSSGDTQPLNLLITQANASHGGGSWNTTGSGAVLKGGMPASWHITSTGVGKALTTQLSGENISTMDTTSGPDADPRKAPVPPIPNFLFAYHISGVLTSRASEYYVGDTTYSSTHGNCGFPVSDVTDTAVQPTDLHDVGASLCFNPAEGIALTYPTVGTGVITRRPYWWAAASGELRTHLGVGQNSSDCSRFILYKCR